MNKKKIVKISAVVASVVVVLVAGIVGINAYIRHRNVVETGNLLGVEWYNETDPQFTITTVEQLYELAELSDFYNFKGQTIKLGADLVVNEGNAEDWAKNAPAKRWNPITGFAGVFDGQGHTISGLYGKGFERRMALFADTQMSCSVKNLSLVNTYFETSGHRGTASIVSHGGGKFSKIYSDAIIVHKGENVGGIASTIDVQSTFEECWFDGDINITSRDCGGIVDEVLGARVNVKHCLFSGYIYSSYDVGGTRTGGIFGRTDKAATIVLNDSLSSGMIECEKKVYTGSMLGASYNGVQFTIADTYVSTETYESAIGESGNKGTFTGSALQMSASELIGVKAYQWTTLNFDLYWAVVENGTPILKHFAETVPSLEGVKKVYDTSWYMPGGFEFTLMTREQLYGFFIMSASTDFQDCKVKLGADIVVNEGDACKWVKEAPELPWFPIASFAGQFDGQGHTISGLYTKSSSGYLGMFGKATAPSIIQNFSLKNSYFEHTGTSSAFLGSVAGDTYGIIQNVYSNAIIVSEGSQVGGIAGRLNDNDKTTSNRTIDGEDYSAVSNCWFDGSIKMLAWEEPKTGACEAGGIVGRVVQGDAIIEHCLNTGTVESEVVGRGLMVGGLVGNVLNAGELRITDCLNTGEIKTNHSVCVGSVLGRMNHDERVVNITDTYTTNESYKIAISTNANKGTLNGNAIRVSASWMTGYKGYQFTTLDFNNYWSVVVSPDGTPILSQFARKKPSVKGLAKMIDTSWYKKDAKEMVIDSLADLYGFALLSSSTNFNGQTIKLAADITVNPVDATTLATWINGTLAPENGWITIGSSAKPFAGTFDGQGHTISGVYSVSDGQYNGLFGVTAPTSMIKNLSLKDSYFAFNGNNKTEEGKDAAAYMGSIVGDLRGDMDSVYSNAIVKSTANIVGGLAGRANGAKDTNGNLTTSTINNCWFDGQVMLTGETARYAGGIAGVAVQGTVEFKHCLNSGSVSNERADGGQFLGGIVGTEWAENTIVNIEDCLNTGAVTAKTINCIGSIVGRIQKEGSTFNIANTSATKESCIKADGTAVPVWSKNGMATMNGGVSTIFEDMLAGYGGYQYTLLDFDNYWALVVNPDATPILRTFANDVPSITNLESIRDWYSADAKTMEIDSVVDLYGFGVLSESTDFAGQTVKLTESLDLDPNVEWFPIGSTSKPFAGTFDGEMNTITGMYVDNTTPYIGMFAVTSPTSMVKNFYLEDSTFIYSGASLKYNEEKKTNDEVSSYLGSIAGDLRGDLDTVYSSAKVQSTGNRVGGLVGCANGAKGSDGKLTTCSINNCWFDGQVILTGNVARYAGGLAGIAMQGTIEISNCLNTGSVSNERDNGGQYLGGILGTDWNACTVNITGCVSAGSVTAPNNINCIGSIAGRVDDKSTYNVINTYAVKGKCVDKNGADKTIWGSRYTDDRVTINNKTVLIGEADLLGVEAYKWTNLNFDAKTGWWAARNEELPRLRSFVKKGQEKSVADVIKPDTAWYDYATKDATDYYIGTPEELLGFAKLYNSGNVFNGKTIHLTDDIPLNPKNAVTDYVKGTSTQEPDNRWIPGGNSTVSTQFAGTFDGHGYTISGIYTVSDSQYVGLFGVIAHASIVKDLRIEDSYLYTSKTGSAIIGSVAGECRGTIDSVYSEAIVESAGGRVGGLVGMANGPKVDGEYGTVTINNSWFNGSINLADDATYSGGIVGLTMQGNVNVTNCLVTGTINNATAKTDGGLIGYVGYAGAHNMVVNISDNLVALKEAVASTDVGNVIGTIKNNDNGTTVTRSYTIVNTYVTEESFAGNSIIADNKENDATAVVGTALMKAEADIQGTKGYTNTLLDFYVSADDSGEWIARSGKVPALKTFVGTVVAEAEVENLESASQTGWYDDSINSYYIGTVSAFKVFRDYVNGGTSFEGKTVYLTDNMNLNPGWTPTLDEDGKLTNSPEYEWTPIGTSEKKFAGTFDGQDHTIRGIYVNANTDNAGLFGIATDNVSTIQNIRIINSYICSSAKNVGSVIGYAQRTKLTNIYSDACVVSTSTNIGGLVGYVKNASSDKDISNCWFEGDVIGSQFCGGLVGYYSYGKTARIKDSLFTGTVHTTANEKNAKTGGIVGGTENPSTYKNITLTISSCISAGTITEGYTSGTGYIGGVIGYRPAKTDLIIENVYTTQSLGIGTQSDTNKETDTTNIVSNVNNIKGDVVYKDVSEGGLDLDYDVWVARKEDVPVPICFVGTVVDKSAVAEDKTGRVYADVTWLTEHAGTESDPYELDSAGELLGFANEVNAGNTFEGKYIVLTKEIDYNEGWTASIDPTTGELSAKTPKNIWIPIGDSTNRFEGTFNGQGHTIRGIYVASEKEYAGFFGYLGNDGEGEAKNFQLVNSYIKSTQNRVGGLAGVLGGKVTNVYVDAYVIGEKQDIGGIAGRMQDSNSKKIDTCWFAGYVGRHIEDSTAAYMAGIVGVTAGGTNVIQNCLNTGTIYHAYTTTNVNQSNATAGIVGGHTSSNTTTIDKCLNLGTVTTPNHAFEDKPENSHRGMGPIIGYVNKDGSTVNITNCIWINVAELDNTSADDKAYGLQYKGTAQVTTSKQYDNETALIEAVKQNDANALVLGFENSGEWKTLTIQESGQTKDTTPILKDFEEFWLSQ